MEELSGKTAVVTGSGRGIGEAIAKQLARIGAKVAMVDVDDDIKETAASIEGARGFVCDVSDEHDVAKLMSDVHDQIGAPSVLVNNAAVGRYAPVAELTRDDWTHMLGINLIGPFLCIRALLDHAPDAGGAIVNITSVGGHLGSPNSSAYAASKGGLMSFTRVLAVELAPRGFRVNAVSPGPIDTPMTAQLSDAKTTERRLSRVPLRRLGAGSEIATVVAFLASEAASFVTGQILCVDGGWTAQSL